VARKRVRLSQRAERDLDNATMYLAGESSIDLALRFYAAAHDAFDYLIRYPEIGQRYLDAAITIPGVRRWQVRGFEKYLIFYRPDNTSIHILRILHGSRDINAHLLEDGWDEQD